MRVVGTVLTHLIGRPLIALNFNQQRYEADFRFNLVRVRENAEQIALLRGRNRRTRAPARALRPRRRQLAADHDAHKKLTFFTAGYAQISIVFPFVVVSPAYFAGNDPARRADADRIRLQQRAERAVVLRQCLSLSSPNGAR